jgi:hypothetical protein
MPHDLIGIAESFVPEILANLDPNPPKGYGNGGQMRDEGPRVGLTRT